jgi:signal transduction histidine kinase
VCAGVDVITTGFGDIIAERMRAEHTSLAARWFDRLSALLPVDGINVFPTSSLLDHVPALIVEISRYLRAPEDEAIAANTAVLEKARELGILRHDQRASLHQVLREYQILSAVLVAFVSEQTERLQLLPSSGETLLVSSRLHQAVNVLMQATVETFVDLYNRTIAEQAERLEQFTRMASHEWRQPLGALQFAVSLLRNDSDPARTRRTLDVMDRNVAHLIELTRKIESVARMSGARDDAIVQELSITTVGNEAARQLREMAEARDVDLRVGQELPSLTVDVGRLELALLNLVSNGIK